jgi:DNA-binding CsgD family transcriptional regulator
MPQVNDTYFALTQVSGAPIDKMHPEYEHYRNSIPLFPNEAVYVYSFQQNRLLYAAGWEPTMGYRDDEITMHIILQATDPAHAPFAFELNNKAVQFLMAPRKDLDQYSYFFEGRKIHKDGSLVPMSIHIRVFSTKNDHVDVVIGRFQVNHSLRFGKVLRYGANGPYKNEFEEILNKELFQYSAISAKEKEALSMVSKGLSFKEIADHLGISNSAVEKRILPLYKRFDVKGLPHLISFAYENFILP